AWPGIPANRKAAEGLDPSTARRKPNQITRPIYGIRRVYASFPLDHFAPSAEAIQADHAKHGRNQPWNSGASDGTGYTDQAFAGRRSDDAARCEQVTEHPRSRRECPSDVDVNRRWSRALIL